MDTSSFEAASFPLDEPPTLIRRRPAGMERRKAARLPIEVDIHVEGAALRFDATTGDLSAGGLFVLTQRTIPIGTHVMLGFTLPNGASLEVLGSVQWHHTGDDRNDEDPLHVSRGPGLGLSFFCLDPAGKALLERFCSTREALYYSDCEH
jgi:uncharacterized protein (TIGR02266 family)